MVMDWWHSELTGEHVYTEDFTLSEHLRELYAAPTAMAPHGMVPITCADEDTDRGDAIGHDRLDVLFAREKAEDHRVALPMHGAEPDDAYT